MNHAAIRRLFAALLTVSLLAACGSEDPQATKTGDDREPKKVKVLDRPDITEAASSSLARRVSAHYVRVARMRYVDSHAEAQKLRSALNKFLQKPTEASHQAAKDAWIKAHTVYSHSEVFRFGNPNVDRWEGKVNSWPVDEGFLDYVKRDQYAYEESNKHALENLIGSNYRIDDEHIEEWQSGQDPKAAPLHTFTDSEANVAIGYHAIEFLLWGQDLNETPTTAGTRSHIDYVKGEGGAKHAGRRALYLNALGRILVRHLLFATLDWDPARPKLYAHKFLKLDPAERLRRILVGMSSMGYAELGGERMRVALLASDQEDEQSCFSDTTHLAIYHNAAGIESIYYGKYQMQDGTVVEGPSLSDLVAKLDPELDKKIQGLFSATMKKAQELRDFGQPFDQMISEENEAGRALIKALIECLKQQSAALDGLKKRTKELAAL